MRDAVLIGIVIVCSLVALRRPVFGLYVFVCFGFLNPHSLTWTFGRTTPMSQIIGIATIVGYVFSPEPKRFPVVWESILLLGLWATFGLTTITAMKPDQALDRFVLISKVFLMIFLSISLISTTTRLHVLLKVIAFSLGFYAIKGGIFVLLTGGQYMVWGPEDSFLAANNSIGLALAMNIPLLAFLLKIEARPWVRLLIRAMVVLSYPAIVGTYSRGAWLGLAIVTALLVLKSKYRLRLVAVGVLFGILFGASLPQFLPDRTIQRYDELANYEQESSAESRFWNWEFCKRVGLAHPLNGGGFDFYGKELYYNYYPEFVERWGTNKYWSCHSVWLTILSEHGIPGFLLWIALIVSCFIS